MEFCTTPNADELHICRCAGKIAVQNQHDRSKIAWLEVKCLALRHFCENSKFIPQQLYCFFPFLLLLSLNHYYLLFYRQKLDVGEIYQHQYWYTLGGLNAGQWHRLDNVFTIVCFSALCFYFMENKKYVYFGFIPATKFFFCKKQNIIKLFFFFFFF